MDQVQSPVTPKPAGNPQPRPVQELPHLVVGEQKRSLAGIFGIIVLSILLLGLPIGIFLVSQRTQLEPKAAVVEPVKEIASGIFMESKLNLAGESLIPVDIFLKSPVDDVNLVSAQIQFDPKMVELDKIATSSANLNQASPFNKWLEVTFDNTKGRVSIIAGVPNPGIKTGNERDSKAYMGTLYLKPKQAGTAVLQISPESQILRNFDNLNIYKTGNDLVLNLTRGLVEATASAAVEKDDKTDPSLIVITNPKASANYSYFKNLDILWSSFNVERISQINLYINGERLGSIAQNIEAKDGKFSWIPTEAIALAYIQPANTYELEIVGVSKDGKVAEVNSGPFGLLGTEEVQGTPPSPESFNQNQLSVADASRILSNYLAVPIQDGSLDFNNDGVINELDWYLLRQNLLIRGIIR